MTNGKTMLIACAYFHVNGQQRSEEQYWGELKASELPAVRTWFDGHVKARGKDLVGAYLYTRTAVFSDNPEYHKPDRMAYMLAGHVHVGM